MMNGKTAYVCRPLTELPPDWQEIAKRFYEKIADVYCQVAGQRAFVPHEHCDPTVHANLSPPEVDAIERLQVQQKTTVLVAVAAFTPSWGGGIEVEMANSAGVPVIVVHPRDKKVSRLLRGNPAVLEVISYRDESHALALLGSRFADIVLARCV